ncbi:TPA: hypothetical protein L5Y86_002911 [Pseudomonas aeruginosa]|uniref:hypothetical protein n=1 Tax=Pseudomonas aeruginosa TaxID=287 RepID=UPI00159CCEBC|nr:hypothetical protein [Pseudomonas aeruginosa]QKZ82150.1 hypothetical protein HWN47_11720 [Pseudomonas aeruginosa]HBP2366933.1 hypothetical protein [Pseudomonas aeruginosa]HBP2409010.1 hypothetical protein [Pseudomonas aeruginosa]HBP2416147.1 hypothetical protein [Pseudomonas aeruginosa]HBP2422916.1 hypothetical protein [Pseudomonas aeruginosa]
MNASVQRIPRIEPASSNFTALDVSSQHSSDESRSALYVRDDLPCGDLFDAAERRQWAARSMLNALAWNEMSEVEGSHLVGIAQAAMLLVSDAESLYRAARRAAKK